MDKTLTPQQIADYLQISYEQALSFIKTSGVRYFKVGNQYRVFEQTLTKFLIQEEISYGSYRAYQTKKI